MWKDKILIWEDTPDSTWNNFGEITTEEFIFGNDLHARGLVIWRKTTLGDFVENTINFYESGKEFLEDSNTITGAMLAISVINFIPLNFEIIKDDDVANEFLALIKRNEDVYFIPKKDFEESRFSKIKDLNILISKLIKNNILEETYNSYNINGKVLNSIHIWDPIVGN